MSCSSRSTSCRGRKRRAVARVSGRLVLREGEATGHAHVVADAHAELVTANEAEELYLLVLGRRAELRHEEHDTLLVPRGSYVVRRQREWDDVAPSGRLDIRLRARGGVHRRRGELALDRRRRGVFAWPSNTCVARAAMMLSASGCRA